uniref:Peptidase metallopeptidase domain-containing protein n=1 Tax=Latimeria chalumnae TaxID=7897 RepID=H3B4I7_LATCH
QDDLQFAEEYLHRFYNLVESANRTKRSSDLNSIEEKLKEMQIFFGLNASGHLDSNTIEVMKEPRCGVPDVYFYRSNTKVNLWSQNILTYRVGQYTRDLPQRTVDNLIHSALKVWSDVSQLTFVPSSDKADIMIHFAKKGHGDLFPFDGPGGTLAHAYGPSDGIGGDTHFDDDEHWSSEFNGYNLYLVAAHEFGHALGLSHSSDHRSLMYPTYKRRNINGLLLSPQDIQNIQKLYGPRSSYLRWPYFFLFPFSLPLRLEEKCDGNLTFDAVARSGEMILFFRDRRLWWFSQTPQLEVKEGIISQLFPKIKSNIDAAYDVPQKGLLYIFKGLKYLTTKDLKVRGNFKSIKKLGFPSSVKQIDGAVYNQKIGKTLFFVGNQYWSYNEDRKIMDQGFPRLIEDDFPGIENNVNAVFEMDGFLNFFSGPKMYKYNNKKKKVVEIKDLNTWLGC